MFQVSTTNFGVHYPDEFQTFEEAIAFCKTIGFECTIHDKVNGGVAGGWSVIGGAHDWRNWK